MSKVFKPEWRKRIPAFCAICGEAFQAVASEVKRGRGKHCSLACSARKAATVRDQVGPANNNWRGGSTNTERKRRYRTNNPAKHEAHLAVRRALRRQELARTPCEVCGAIRVEGHHDDYGKPLSVRWLCKRHHMAAHGGRLNNHL